MNDREIRERRDPAAMLAERLRAEAAEPPPAPAMASLLARPPHERRGSAPVVASGLLSLQRSQGNQAVQRLVRGADGGLPTRLRTAVETLSGVAMDDVRVHPDSARPAQVDALAYAQGSDIHLGPGQEHHLAHEAWHVVQQKRGQAGADAHFKGQPVSADETLEHEADIMGEQAARLASRDVARPPAATSAVARRPVIQGKWRDEAQLDPWSFRRADIEGALFELARKTGSKFLPQLEGVRQFVLPGVVELVRKHLRAAADDSESHATDDLVWQVVQLVMSQARPALQGVEEGADDENDHPEEDSPDVEENLIVDPSHVDTRELQRWPELLFLIFRNCAVDQGFTVEDITQDAFKEWYSAGVVTRRGFREIIERNRPQPMDLGGQPMMMKRLPNKASGPASYTSSNFGNFVSVTYTTDAKANIDFTKTTSHTTWANPVMPGTVVKLQTGSTRPGYGVLNNGYETKLFRAGRSRHNMIANRLRPDLVALAAASYTWHHRTKEYDMELVDYECHRKHGHNGGYLFWRDGQ